MHISTDKNEDGYSEKILSYGKDFEQSGFSIDKNNDGIYETQFIFLESGDTLILTDENSNGFLEMGE